MKYKELNILFITLSAIALVLSSLNGIDQEAYSGPLFSAVSFMVVLLSAFHLRQNLIRGISIYLLGIAHMYLARDGQLGVGLNFWYVSFAFLVADGFFTTSALPKALAFFLIFGINAGICTLLQNDANELRQLLPPIGALLIVIALFKDRFFQFLKGKPTLNLCGRLTATEAKYLMEYISGKSYKEIAFNNDVSDSTIRNMMARAMRKLELVDGNELIRFGERHLLVWKPDSDGSSEDLYDRKRS